MRRLFYRSAGIVAPAAAFLLTLTIRDHPALDGETWVAVAAGEPAGERVYTGPPLSHAARMSASARENKPEEALDIARLQADIAAFELGLPIQANADFNRRPKNEPSIAIKPGTGGESAIWIIGANDYGIGVP
jgi:hypothetical protein